MIELKSDALVVSFPEVHPEARLRVAFQRTLRIPDDRRDYPLPPGLGRFPVRHVDDFAARVPGAWMEHGGVMLPMYQSEAMWIAFTGEHVRDQGTYPFAVKIAAGKIDAVTGEAWNAGVHRPQDYAVVPEQPWLDGFCVEKGIIRQFVAMPLGSGYSAEEQISGKAEHGGLQVVAYPMKREVFERRFPKQNVMRNLELLQEESLGCSAPAACSMGLAPGGRMRQEIAEDPFELSDWDMGHSSRCFVHICNSMVWRAITGSLPPAPPPTAKEYTRAGLPWFEYYREGPAVGGSAILQKLKSVLEMGKSKGEVALPENESVVVKQVKAIKARPGQVREGSF